MTLKQLIDMVDDLKPNAYSNDTKTAWVNEVEGAVQTDVWLLGLADVVQYDYSEDQAAELLVPPPHSKLYWAYLSALIDFGNGEYDKYENGITLYNGYMGEYVRWYARNYHPADGDAEALGYYLSAYAIAVKHGYEGTEAEWLASLVGPAGGVDSFAGRQGAVVPASGDYDAAMVGAEAAGAVETHADDTGAHEALFADKADLSVLPNRNLLHNWDFRNPVKQRGVTSWSSGYGIDRWKIIANNSGTPISVSSNGLNTSISEGFIQIKQYLPTELNITGKPVTASIIVGGVVYSTSFIYGSSVYVSNLAPNIDFFSSSDTMFGFGFAFTGAVSGLESAKLELGAVSTLANDPPADYGEELAKCQRYYQLTCGYCIASVAASSILSVYASFPVQMRATPAVSLFKSQIDLYDTANKTFSASGLGAVNASKDGILYCNIDGSYSVAPVGLFIKINDSFILACSADL